MKSKTKKNLADISGWPENEKSHGYDSFSDGFMAGRKAMHEEIGHYEIRCDLTDLRNLMENSIMIRTLLLDYRVGLIDADTFCKKASLSIIQQEPSYLRLEPPSPQEESNG